MPTLTYAIAPAPAELIEQFTAADVLDYTRFRVDWPAIQRLLAYELDQIEATTDPLIELWVQPDQITVNRLLRAGAQPGHPGIRLTFDDAEGERVRFVATAQPSWRHNVYAVAKTLEAMRGIERWGATTGKQLLRAHLALPVGGGYELGQTSGMTKHEALNVLWAAAGFSGEIPVGAFESGAGGQRIVRMARGLTHPDRNNGVADRYNEVEYAARVLGLDT